MSIKVPSPIVSVDWLNTNLEHDNLIILDGTIPKVTAKSKHVSKKLCIKNAIFFDIKKQFSDTSAELPNTMIDAKTFEKKAQELGINNDSCIVVYDDFGLYSAPRVWWMFQLMGFTNIAVLNGGLPEWITNDYPTEEPKDYQLEKGNFKSDYQANKIVFTDDVLSNITSEDYQVLDARSKGRFYATEAEPRVGLRGGHIPKSYSLPFSEVSNDNQLKTFSELEEIYNSNNPKNKPFIFTCGSGVTASVLALGAEIAGFSDYAVYDGSWTEWASTLNLPVEK